MFSFFLSIFFFSFFREHGLFIRGVPKRTWVFLRRRKRTYRLAGVIIHIAGIVGFAPWIASCPDEAMRARELHPVH